MLSDKTIEIFDQNEMTVHERNKYAAADDGYSRDIEFYSPEGEDVIESIDYDGTNEGFVKAFRERAEQFDVDEHAELWIPGRGQRGVPDSISALVDDAKWIKATLLKVAEELEAIEK